MLPVYPPCACGPQSYCVAPQVFPVCLPFPLSLVLAEPHPPITELSKPPLPKDPWPVSHKGQVQTLPEDPEFRSTYSGEVRSEGVKPVWGNPGALS